MFIDGSSLLCVYDLSTGGVSLGDILDANRTAPMNLVVGIRHFAMQLCCPFFSLIFKHMVFDTIDLDLGFRGCSHLRIVRNDLV